MKRRFLMKLGIAAWTGAGLSCTFAAETTHCDVVVVGAGAAGLSAALEAANAGTSVILIEKDSFVGGDTLVSGGFFNAPDPELQSKSGIIDSPEFYLQQIRKSANGKGSPFLQKTLAENAFETLEWLKSNGIVFEDHIYEIYGSRHPRCHKPKGVSGTSYIQKLSEACLKAGVRLYTKTEFVDFVKEANRFLGINVVNENRLKTIFAKSIVLAAGGFGNNQEMLKRYMPNLKFVYSDTKGSGYVLKKAIDHGLKVENMNAIECVPEGSFLDQFSARIYVFIEGVIFVNENGERFVDETATRRDISNALIAQGSRRCYTICGSECISLMDKILQKNLYRAYFSGQVWKADTLEALCETIDIPHSQVKKYAVDQSTKTNFPRKSPFWAVRMYPWVHYTLGGLAINEKGQCSNEQGETIPNIFAAGQITGNIHGENRLGGNGLTDAFVFGRIAGREAAKLAKNT